MMIIVVTALFCEAKPIIDFYHLNPVDYNVPFSCYEDADKQIILAVSGTGKVRMASCVSAMLSLIPVDSETYVVNVGVAGSLTDISEVFCVNKYVDNASSKSFYPDMIVNPQVTECALITSSKLVNKEEMKRDYLYDLEGSAFFESASLFVAPSHIMSLKIVSDNGVFEKITSDYVKSIIESQISRIENAFNAIKSTIELKKSEYSQPVDAEILNFYVQQLRLTEYKANELKRLFIYSKSIDFDLPNLINKYLPVENKKSGIKVLEDISAELFS